MTQHMQRAYSAALKAKVSLAPLKGEKTLKELAYQYEVHASQIMVWKAQLLARAEGVFGGNTPDACLMVLKHSVEAVWFAAADTSCTYPNRRNTFLAVYALSAALSYWSVCTAAVSG